MSSQSLDKFQWLWPEKTLVLAATPIGNIGDASPRLREAFMQASIIAAEDTRRTKKLIHHLGLQTRSKLHIVAYHDHNESERARELVAAIDDGHNVLVVSDAGMPLTSDPGHSIVQEAIKHDITITAIPGPSAVPTAIALSGLVSDRFRFEGFLPKKQSQIRARLKELQGEEITMVFFESPQRIASTLTIAIEVFGAERPAALCRELTKLYETIYRGTLGQILQDIKNGIKGELVLLIEGQRTALATLDLQEGAAAARRLSKNENMRLKDAAKTIAKDYGLRANEVYERALRIQ